MTSRWIQGTIRRPAAGGGVPSRHVIKVGGSLLNRPDWPEAIAALALARLSPLVIVGGGPVVEGLRRIDTASSRPPALMHQLAIDAMTLTARLVADGLRLPLVGDAACPHGVLDVAAWLETVEVDLPVGWHVTSDSIAAVVARHTGRGLLLAKSVAPPAATDDLAGLAEAGWVDAWFPRAAATLADVRWAAPA